MVPSYRQNEKSYTEKDSGSNVVILASSALGEAPIQETDFMQCNDLFIAVYGDAYADDRTGQHARVNLLFELMKRAGYSRGDMERALLDFFASKQSVYGDTWKPADILAQHPPYELLTFTKYCQLSVGERKHFVAYNTPHGVLFGDARFIGDKLERVAYKPEAKQLPEHREGVTPETQEEITWCMRALKAEDELSELRRQSTIVNERAVDAFKESEDSLTQRIANAFDVIALPTLDDTLKLVVEQYHSAHAGELEALDQLRDAQREILRLHGVLRGCGHGDKVPPLNPTDPPF